jgi:hypothetical protein
MLYTAYRVYVYMLYTAYRVYVYMLYSLQESRSTGHDMLLNHR